MKNEESWFRRQTLTRDEDQLVRMMFFFIEGPDQFNIWFRVVRVLCTWSPLCVGKGNGTPGQRRRYGGKGVTYGCRHSKVTAPFSSRTY